MQFYDAHVHFFFEGALDSLLKKYERIGGFLGGGFIVLEAVPDDWECIYRMVPRAYHHLVTPETLHPSVQPLEWFRTLRIFSVIPYLDTRFFQEEHVSALERFVENGYKGVKILYIPEEDDSIGVAGWEHALGRSVPESERLTADLVREAASLDVPVLFHVDLRRYGGFIEELLSAYPDLPFNIPHFGSSRKKMARLLERYSNCYSDFSSLLPFMQQASEAYRSFIESFPDRILFGSDATFGCPEMLEEYVAFVPRFLNGELLRKVCVENYRRFHRID